MKTPQGCKLRHGVFTTALPPFLVSRAVLAELRQGGSTIKTDVGEIRLTASPATRRMSIDGKTTQVPVLLAQGGDRGGRAVGQAAVRVGQRQQVGRGKSGVHRVAAPSDAASGDDLGQRHSTKHGEVGDGGAPEESLFQRRTRER